MSVLLKATMKILYDTTCKLSVLGDLLLLPNAGRHLQCSLDQYSSHWELHLEFKVKTCLGFAKINLLFIPNPDDLFNWIWMEPWLKIPSLSLKWISLENSYWFLSYEHHVFWDTISFSFLFLRVIFVYNWVPSSWQVPYKIIIVISNQYPWRITTILHLYKMILRDSSIVEYFRPIFISTFLGI